MGDVVVGEVQLHQDFEVLERIAVYLLQKNRKVQDSVKVRFLGWAVLRGVHETLELNFCRTLYLDLIACCCNGTVHMKPSGIAIFFAVCTRSN